MAQVDESEWKHQYTFSNQTKRVPLQIRLMACVSYLTQLICLECRGLWNRQSELNRFQIQRDCQWRNVAKLEDDQWFVSKPQLEIVIGYDF